MNDHYLASLVRDYKHNWHLNNHLDFYRNLPTIEESIDYAALSKRWDGKRHSHQRRLSRQTLKMVKENLLSNKEQLERCSSFEEIFRLVCACAVGGFGELSKYDTALRLAARLGKMPEQVYLHADTRKGAAALNLDGNRQAIPMNELPRPLQALQPHQVEDFLCIYKDKLINPTSSDTQTARSCVAENEPKVHASDCSAPQVRKKPGIC